MSQFKSWPQDEKPREKLLSKGAKSLSDAELLAIFLRTGRQGKNVINLAKEIIQHFGDLKSLFAASESEFCKIKGIGQAKYVQLQACLEMNQRRIKETITVEDVFKNPSQVKQYVQSQLMGEPNEVFAVILLNNQHHVLAFEKLFFGTINASSVHPRVVIQRCLFHNAAAIIVAHNHPSGVAEPSLSDIEMTKTLKFALELLDIRLLDHLIVANNRVTSLAEIGQI